TAAGSDGLATHVSPAKSAQRPKFLLPRQCAGPCGTDGGSPGGNPAPAGIAPAGHSELASAASPRSRRRPRVPAGGCAPGWPAGVTTTPVDTISSEGA